MTSAMLTDFLKSMALLGAFLLLGVFLRAKVKILQKAFIPASVIGGFLLLIFDFSFLPRQIARDAVPKNDSQA